MIEKCEICRKSDDGEIKVSVIMLAYNHAPFIRQAIDSVLRQHVEFSVEIWIGDDASTDGTGDIIRDYAKRYPQTIFPVVRETNLGATKNLYDLMERAQGNYLAYLECDDYWCDDCKLRRQIDFLEEHPEYIACTHKIALIDREGNPCKEEIPWISREEKYTIEDFKGIILPGHFGSILHRNIFLNCKGKYKGLITLHPFISDRSLCLLLASCGPIHQIQEIMGCYRMPTTDRNSATTILYKKNTQKILDDYFFTKELERYAIEHLKCEADFKPHKKELLYNAVCTALRHPSWCNLMIALQMLRFEHSAEFIKDLFVRLFRKITEKF